jgi:O-antigen/teichoic acid export membrane protein
VVVRDRTDTFLIGRLLGMQAVGIYAVSVELAGLALTELVSPLAQVCMPGFAATLREANTSTVAAAFRRALAVTTAVAVPTGVGLSLVSEAVVLAGLGRGWMEAAGLIAVMAIAFIPIALGLIANSLLVAHAALQRLFAITAAAAAVRISVLIAIGARYGLLGIAVASCAVSVSEQAVLIGAAQRLVRLPAQGLLAAIWRPLLAAIVMAIALWQLGLGWLPAPPAEAGAAARLLGAAVPLGAATFTAVLALAWWVSGRPQGAESDLLAYLSKGAVGLRRRLAEGRPGRHARRREE